MLENITKTEKEEILNILLTKLEYLEIDQHSLETHLESKGFIKGFRECYFELKRLFLGKDLQ